MAQRPGHPRFSRAIASAASIASRRCEETGHYLPIDRTLEQFRLRFISEPDSLKIISVLDIADQLDPDPDDDGTDPDPATPPICTPVHRETVDAIGGSRSRHSHGRSRKRGIGKAVPAKIRPAKARKGLKIARRRQSLIDGPIQLAKRSPRPRRFRFVKAH
uniref:Uncharacterized protein n=1 Tax=Caulobacter sp. (strain K31) TaxID=366602 RepID=B0T7G3_CAUSK